MSAPRAHPDPRLVARMRRLRWTSFVLVSAAYVLSFFHRIAPNAIAGELRTAFEASGAELGVLAARGDGTVVFDADEEAEFGKAVATMDLARAGGASTIVVLTAPLAAEARAVGGSVRALAKVVGPRLGPNELDKAVEILGRQTHDEIAAQFDVRDLYGRRPAEHALDLERLRDVVERNPNEPALAFLYGYELWFNGRKKEALPFLERAAKGAVDPTPIKRFLN